MTIRDVAEDILWITVDWIDLHLTALKLGVSAGWLKDRQASARAFLARHEQEDENRLNYRA